jgi:3-methyladenine DNA glycosylase AlkD
VSKEAKVERSDAEPVALARAIVGELRSRANPRNVEWMRRFGIVSKHEQLGISVSDLRQIGRPYRRHHALALELWKTHVSEAMVLAAVIDDPAQVTPKQMETWIKDCDNWALVDALCFGLFDRSAHALDKVTAWCSKRPEFVRRGGYALMAGMAVHRKELSDDTFVAFLPLIREGATDERNFVRKAVNWALRQIGKRNARLLKAAREEANRIARIDSRAARRIASDALREFSRRGSRLGGREVWDTRGTNR